MSSAGIIINADDFGASAEINKTILLLHKKGIVSSTTIIAAGKAFNDAIEIAKEYPKLGIGAHLCLDGSFIIGEGYRTIIGSGNNNYYNGSLIVNKLRRFSVDQFEIYKEYCLQIEKILDHKIHLSHLDHHHHLHSYIQVLNSMIKAAKRYKIGYIRPQKMYPDRDFIKRIYRNVHQLYLKSKLNTIDGIYIPRQADYEEQFNSLSRVLNLKNRIIEIMLHPVDNNYSETNFFSSDRVLNLLKNSIIVNYNDLKY